MEGYTIVQERDQFHLALKCVLTFLSNRHQHLLPQPCCACGMRRQKGISSSLAGCEMTLAGYEMTLAGYEMTCMPPRLQHNHMFLAEV